MTDQITIEEYIREHLPYELSMMLETHELYKNLDKIKDIVCRNMIIESFCTHARNLNDFVTNDSGKGNNSVVARDFIKFSEPSNNKLTGAFQRVNEQIDHLAKNRAGARKFDLEDANSIVGWLVPVMKRFVSGLTPTQAELWNKPKKTVSNLGHRRPGQRHKGQLVRAFRPEFSCAKAKGVVMPTVLPVTIRRTPGWFRKA
jgi:hypothetical protein